jgi:NAD(P)-dependent dehydrogenase (short-subunit alcohol dehydrogenase family)
MYRSQIEGEAVAFFNVAQPSLTQLRLSGGSIVAVTTAATRRYPVRDGLSSGTKGAVEAVVRAIAAEEGRFGIRANCVGPGMLTDGMAARLMASGDSVMPSTLPKQSASSPRTEPTSSAAR